MFWLALGLLAALVASAWAGWRAWRGRPSPPDPDTAFTTPYRNARPGVQYVGDAACAECHADIAEAYRRHPMGRSLAPAGRAPGPEKADGRFEKFGWRFSVERRGGRVFHKEARPGPGGQALAEVEAEVHFALGSGARGRSFLINRGGYVFQSPLSWFTQKKAWDLSPGFTEQVHFERPVQPLCLFCHADQVNPVEHTLNRFHEPLFPRGLAIGCERCHGPGELHVAARRGGDVPDTPDYTIVNPRHLEAPLRESVCQQCHLQGAERVLRRGRQLFDYRPGLPLHHFWSVFVRPGAGDKAVGQVEQMYASRCFQKSGGRLGCISCHDPHRLPEPAAKADYYCRRCLECHGEADCTRPAPARRKEEPQASCITCHMPRFASSDIAHTAVTDHRIPRRPGPVAGRPPGAGPGESPLVHFHADRTDPDDSEVTRDLGVALIEQAWKAPPAPAARLARLALPLLEDAGRAGPEDVPAWEGQGAALQMLGRPEDAMAAFQSALARAPRRERTLTGAALLAERMRLRDAAVAYWERALAVNPWSAHAHGRLARLLGERGEWGRALKECQAMLRLHPGGIQTRTFLVLSYLRTGDKRRAQEEFERVLGMDPPHQEELRRWFAEQAR
jgi:hypothetical protein